MDELTPVSGALADRHLPLADRMRPQTLDEVVGQPQLTGTGAALRTALDAGQLHSCVLYGPPGTGKTTIATCIARAADATVETMNAVTDGIADLRKVIARAQERRNEGQRTLLFIDEIARWNKGQQDALLPYVESGDIILVGATTENPSFELNRALVSRVQVHTVRPLADEDLSALADRALTDVKRGVGIPIDDDREPYTLADDAREHLLLISDGDARRMLGIVERAAQLRPDGGAIDLQAIIDASGRRAVAYDKGGDEHYAITSAFIKSIRGSDADAALYWLARMEAGGEPPEFVARRLVIAASEEVGTAASGALAVAVSGMDAVKMVGAPECWLALAHVTAYLARAPKSWAAYQGLGAARKLVAERPHYDVPQHLKNPSTEAARAEGAGAGYVHPGKGDASAQSYLPPELAGARGRIYRPSGSGQDR